MTYVSSSNTAWRPLTIAGVFVIAFAFPLLCRAGDDAASRARAEFEAGVAAFAAHEYEQALERFENSYEVVPKNAVLFNIAMCQKALARYVDSLAAFERYRRDAGDRMKPSRRAEVESAVAEMERLVGKIAVEGAPEGATIRIDGIERGSAPLGGPVVVDPGRHSISVSRDGYIALEIDVSVSSGAATSVRAVLEEARPSGAEVEGSSAGEPASEETAPLNSGPVTTITDGASVGATASTPTAPTALPEDASQRRFRILWGGVGGAALALGVAGGVVGTLFVAEGYDDVQRGNAAAASGDAKTRADAVADVDVDRKGAIVGFAVGGALVATGAIAVIVAATREAPPKKDTRNKKIGVAVVPTLGGAALTF